MCQITLDYTTGASREIVVGVRATKEGNWEPLWLPNGIDVILPTGEERAVKAGHGVGAATDKGRDERGRRVWTLQVAGRSGSVSLWTARA